MTKHESVATLEAGAVPLPIPVMTRADKLRRLATLCRQYAGGALHLYSNLEHKDAFWLTHNTPAAHTALGLAAGDPILADHMPGEAGKPKSFKDVITGLELSNQDVHAFSCDCGGTLTNNQMADRIDRIASA